MIKYRVNESFERDVVPSYGELVPIYTLKKHKFWYNELGDLVPADENVPFENIVIIEELVEYDKKNIQSVVDSYKVTSLDYLLDKFDLNVVLNQTSSYTFTDNVVEFENVDKIDLASKWKTICNDFREKNHTDMSDLEILKLLNQSKKVNKEKIENLMKGNFENEKKEIKQNEE